MRARDARPTLTDSSLRCRRSLSGLESDGARQAVAVGLRHFARSTGCRLIAEGIETERELAALRALDIGLGQGGLLGRPLPVAAGQA